MRFAPVPRLSAAFAAATVLLVGCDESGTFEPGREPAAVSISPASLLLGFVGARGQLTARVTAADGSTLELPVTWMSLAPSIATVSETGAVTAVTLGTARVVAAAEGLADTAEVVVARRAATIAVSPDSVVLAEIGQTVSLTARPLDGAGNQLDGVSVTWSSADTSVARVSTAGVVTAVSNGTTTVTARAGNATGSADVRVNAGAASISLLPDTVRLTQIGGQRQVETVLLNLAGDTIDADVSWASASTPVATVTQSGIVIARGVGTTTITATSGFASAEATVIVTQRPMAVVIEPVSVTAAPGTTTRFTATVQDGGGTPIPGSILTWSSTRTGVATVDGGGLATTVADGTTSIIARSEALADTATLVVRPVQLARVELEPASVLLDLGGQRTLVVQAFEAGGNRVVPRPGTFSSSNSSVVTVDGAGRLTGVSRGQAWVRVAFGSVIDSSLVTVSRNSVPPPGPFDITVRFVGVDNPLITPSPAQVEAVRAAEARWEAVIDGDLAFGNPDVDAGACGVDHEPIDEQVDDVLVLIQVEGVDGSGGRFSEVGGCVVRTANGLPILATISLDFRDLNDLESSGDLDDAILREFGHALGFGTSAPWEVLLMGTAADDPYFTGPQARAEFTAAGFSAPNPVPVENRAGLEARHRRWRESVLGNELMTGTLDAGTSNPLSRITVGAMADLGYTVDFSAADPFSATTLQVGRSIDLDTSVRPALFGLTPEGRMRPLR